ncbi:HpcH/HpaI aldolase/citrate lyase family protein [Rhodoferax sediminis]|uniref:CoA ester lyase n=1 Tax=Rhodoferax sediminis TaxID=2509614 RepID=A0A515DAC5_9BURK|nr:CoA ester lyase [Rhodoferax sediminis]QDL37362.1 CoA ester lyase [Rhodoferax sediminis]
MSYSLAPAIVRAHSFLFVPANRPERVAKALASGADAVIVDLEDAVPLDAKGPARDQLAQVFSSLTAPERDRLLVRINAAGMPWHEDDLARVRELAAQGLAAVMVPKAESATALAHVAAAIGASCALVPLMESAAGLATLDALAASPQVVRLAFGNLDFQADLGLACGPDEAELVPVRLALVLASRRAALAAPIDGVTASTTDEAQIQMDAQRSRRAGFGAKLCIHPAQVAVVNAALAPTTAELDWARRVLAAYAQAGGGVFSLDDRMVDAPVVRLAQRVVDGAPDSP